MRHWTIYVSINRLSKQPKVKGGVSPFFINYLSIRKMKNKEITVSKEANGKIQYLTEILPEIPTNTILYKKLTGLGATYGELKAHRNSIIIEPNKPVISGKCKDPKHGKDNLFGVFDGVYADDIVIIRKTKCFDFWERNVLFPKTKRSFFRTPKHPLPCPFPLNFSLLIITKKFGNLAKNRYICIV